MLMPYLFEFILLYCWSTVTPVKFTCARLQACNANLLNVVEEEAICKKVLPATWALNFIPLAQVRGRRQFTHSCSHAGNCSLLLPWIGMNFVFCTGTTSPVSQSVEKPTKVSCRETRSVSLDGKGSLHVASTKIITLPTMQLINCFYTPPKLHMS